MDNINTSQVQSTNDASTLSKCSAVSKNYFKDDFIQEFVWKKKSRASLIHLGYYARAVIINKLVTEFIEYINLQKFLKFQIISCGSGFDTIYWRLSEARMLDDSTFVEIDFSDVIKKKILLINQSTKLSSVMCKFSNEETLDRINKINDNYYLLEADLSDLNLMENLFNCIHIDYDIPTLFLSECVITYMKESDSSNLIKWMATKFKNSTFINYEQIHPEDGFGQVMLKHFDKLQSSLLSVSKFPNCDSHYIRYINLGFEKSLAVSEWNALSCVITQSERQRVLSLESFDEFEEFHMKCVHYVIAIASKGISCSWSPLFEISKDVSVGRVEVQADMLQCDLELFRHSSCCIRGESFIFGGSSRKSRSSKIYRISYGDCLNVKTVKSSGHPNVKLDMVYGSVVYFELNKVPFICLYGGRTSPDKVWNNGSPVIFELCGDEFILKLIINNRNPEARYRTQMFSLNLTENEALCWVFGGRTTDLNKPLSDFWELSITQDNEKNLVCSWKQHEKKHKNWPCSRISHSLIGCTKRSELFIIGGLTLESSSCVLNDIWKWCCRSESWEKMQLAGTLLPRYGHTAHLLNDDIFLVGGVNTLAGSQPELAKIDLRNLTVVEYTLALPHTEPVLLYNHTSELVKSGNETCIWILGGGGNCFSFGTYLNPCAVCIKLSHLS